jgi:predicted nucleic acid binding AN1-type Zn finger protein
MLYFIPNDVDILFDGSKKTVVEESKENIILPIIKKKPEKKEEIHKKSKKRCNLKCCKKKLKLTDLECRCGYRLCSKHRLPELHFCTQNFKEKNKEKYLKKVQLGGGEFIKIDKI